MKWSEFKEKIDAQMKEKGISEDSEIYYIDFSVDDDPEAFKDGTGFIIH